MGQSVLPAIKGGKVVHLIIEEADIKGGSKLVEGRSGYGKAFFSGRSHGGRGGLKQCLAAVGKGDVVVLEFNCADCCVDWKAVSVAPADSHEPRVSPSELHGFYAGIIGYVREKGARPIVLSLPVLLPQRFFDYVSRGLKGENILAWLGGDVNAVGLLHERYNKVLEGVCVALGVPMADIGTLLLDRRSIGDCYGEDGLRPNALGRAMIAERLGAMLS